MVHTHTGATAATHTHTHTHTYTHTHTHIHACIYRHMHIGIQIRKHAYYMHYTLHTHNARMNVQNILHICAQPACSLLSAYVHVFMNECCMRAYIYVYHMYVEYSCTYIVDATPNACPAHMWRLRHIHITNVEFRSLPRNRIWQHM